MPNPVGRSWKGNSNYPQTPYQKTKKGSVEGLKGQSDDRMGYRRIGFHNRLLRQPFRVPNFTSLSGLEVAPSRINGPHDNESGQAYPSHPRFQVGAICPHKTLCSLPLCTQHLRGLGTWLFQKPGVPVAVVPATAFQIGIMKEPRVEGQK